MKHWFSHSIINIFTAFGVYTTIYTNKCGLNCIWMMELVVEKKNKKTKSHLKEFSKNNG